MVEEGRVFLLFGQCRGCGGRSRSIQFKEVLVLLMDVLSFEEFSMTYVTIYDIHHTWQRRQRRRCWALSTECLNALFMPPDNLFKAMAMDERSSRGT